MNVILLYLHLLAIALVSIIFTNLTMEEHPILQAIFGTSAIGAMLTAYGYGIWSIVQILIK